MTPPSFRDLLWRAPGLGRDLLTAVLCTAALLGGAYAMVVSTIVLKLVAFVGMPLVLLGWMFMMIRLHRNSLERERAAQARQAA